MSLSAFRVCCNSCKIHSACTGSGKERVEALRIVRICLAPCALFFGAGGRADKIFILDAVFLLAVGGFLLSVELFDLQLTILAFLLTVGAFLLTILVFLLTVGLFCLQWESASNKGLKGL